MVNFELKNVSFVLFRSLRSSSVDSFRCKIRRNLGQRTSGRIRIRNVRRRRSVFIFKFERGVDSGKVVVAASNMERTPGWIGWTDPITTVHLLHVVKIKLLFSWILLTVSFLSLFAWSWSTNKLSFPYELYAKKIRPHRGINYADKPGLFYMNSFLAQNYLHETLLATKHELLQLCYSKQQSKMLKWILT